MKENIAGKEYVALLNKNDFLKVFLVEKAM